MAAVPSIMSYRERKGTEMDLEKKAIERIKLGNEMSLQYYK